LHSIVGRLLARRINIEVDVWSERERHAPMGHRQTRIELRGALKRADSFVMIESEHEGESLIEKLLCNRVCGGNGMVNAANPGHQRRWLLGLSWRAFMTRVLRAGKRTET